MLLIEHLAALREAGIKLTEDQMRFGTTVQEVFNSLDQKLLQSGIKADELRNDHLGALAKELKLIDMQSMAELEATFGKVAKAADTVFEDLKSHWYSFGIGASGAKHALDDFQTKYDSLLSQGKASEASDLLKGTLGSAHQVLDLMNRAKAVNAGTLNPEARDSNGLANANAIDALRKSGVGITENEVKAQQTLVDALQAQIGLEIKIDTLNKQDKGNAKTSTGKELNALASEGAREAAQHRQKMAEISLAIDREQAAAALEISRASVMARLLSDMHLADEERDIQLRGNKDLQAALDKGGKDYNNQLQALRNRAVEIEAQHTSTIDGLKSKAMEATYRKDLTDIEQGEREKIEATQQGSNERLAAIDEAMKNERALGLQDTTYYRELQTQRVEVARMAAAEAAKLAAEAGRIDAEHIQRTGELALAAEREQAALRNSSRRVTAQQRVQEEVHFANEEYALKLQAMLQEEAALDKGGKDYQNRLREIQNRETELVRAHENEISDIKNKAVEERNSKILASEDRYLNTIAEGLTRTLMGQQSFAATMKTIGSQVESDLLQAAIKHIETNMLTRQSDAAKAARLMFNAGAEMPFPANIVAAPLLGAAGYAAVMAFQTGTDMVPGHGTGDKVPAMLEPGEGVVPGGVMDGLRSMARSGSMGGGVHHHVTVSPTYHVQALDSSGMAKILDKHSDTLAKHVSKEIRKLNQ